MKKLVCEMCGSTDLIKQDGVFVCQACGCRYSVEEAKKMMVEGTVDVSGSTVKVDTSDDLANLYQIARRARDDNNSENAARYYDMILVKDPTSWEAAFYVVYFNAMNCKIAYIQSAAVSVSNCEGSVLKLIRDHVPESEQRAAVMEVTVRSCLIATTLANGAKTHYAGIDQNIRGNYTQEYVNNVCAARDILYTCGSQIEAIFGGRNDILLCAAKAWEAGVEIHTSIMPYFSISNRQANEQQRNLYIQNAGKYDIEYKKKHLQAEIEQIQKQIEYQKAAADPKFYKSGLWIGIFSLVGGLLGLFVGIEDEFSDFGILGVMAVLFLIAYGIYYIHSALDPDPKKLAEKKASEARKQLEKKRAELAALDKECNK